MKITSKNIGSGKISLCFSAADNITEDLAKRLYDRIFFALIFQLRCKGLLGLELSSVKGIDQTTWYRC